MCFSQFQAYIKCLEMDTNIIVFYYHYHRMRNVGGVEK